MNATAAALDGPATPWGALRSPGDLESGEKLLGRGRPLRGATAVTVELRWRERPADAGGSAGIVAGRWIDDCAGERLCLAPASQQDYTIEIALRRSAVELSSGSRRLLQGWVAPGTVVVTGPDEQPTALFRGPCELLHLFVPPGVMESLCASEPSAAAARLTAQPAWTDPVVERLSLALVRADELGPGAAALYLRGLISAILARVVAKGLFDPTPARTPGGEGLLKWRLRRVIEFVDANLSEPLRLADIAGCAGLSRMHFAAQFRAATGVSPHEYVISRRIERAQSLLRDANVPLVEVALSVGFQTQAHFSTVFRRIIGETPGRWRQKQLSREGSSCSSC